MPFFVLFFLPVYGRVPVPAVGFPRANGCECVGFGRSTGERAPPCARIIPLFSFLRKRKGSRCGSVTPRLVREPRKARPRFLGTPRRPFRLQFTAASPRRGSRMRALCERLGFADALPHKGRHTGDHAGSPLQEKCQRSTETVLPLWTNHPLQNQKSDVIESAGLAAARSRRGSYGNPEKRVRAF